MKFKNLLTTWRNPSILLFGIGVSNIGDWIYLIGLNLIVLDRTGSPLAVAGLYILKPLAALFTNFWAGSVIDRMNKRNLMVILDLLRAGLVAFLPFLSSIWLVYSVVFLISMAGSMFDPTAMTYITKFIPAERRKRFNALRSLVESGGFLTGPAIAGILFMIGTPIFAIDANAVSFLLSGFVALLMPNLEKQKLADAEEGKLSFGQLKRDWSVVLNFSRRHFYVMLVYFFFSCMLVMTAAVDSLEASFSKKVLLLSNSEYGLLVSIAGAGIALGAVVNTLFMKKIAISWLIGWGALFVSLGYMIYAFSHGFSVAAAGFFILSFSLAFAETGFYTFYQNHIPVEIMGRVGSVYGLVEAVLVIIATAAFGIAAQLISIQFVVIGGTFVMLLFTVILCGLTFQSSKAEFYSTGTADSKGN